MQDRLSMEANDIDSVAGQLVRSQEILDGFGMCARHQSLGVSQHTRTRVTLGDGYRIGKRLPQQIALAVSVGAITCRAECADSLTVRLNQRDIDPIKGRAAHQPDRLQQRPLLRAEMPLFTRILSPSGADFREIRSVESNAGPDTPQAQINAK